MCSLFLHFGHVLDNSLTGLTNFITITFKDSVICTLRVVYNLILDFIVPFKCNLFDLSHKFTLSFVV